MGRFKLNSKEAFLNKTDEEKRAIINSTLKMLIESYNNNHKLLVRIEDALMKDEFKIRDLQSILECKNYNKYLEV